MKNEVFATTITILCATVLAGCAGGGSNDRSDAFAQWTRSSTCTNRIVVASPDCTVDEAQQLSEKYDAAIEFGATKNALSKGTTSLLSHSVGAIAPSSWARVRSLSRDMEAINSTGKHWDIFVLESGSWLFSQTLKAMPASGLATAKGQVHLVGWSKNTAIEAEVARVCGGSFQIVYE